MENDRPQNAPPEKTAPPKPRVSNTGMFLMLAIVIGVVFLIMRAWGEERSEITIGFFRQELLAGNIADAKVQGDKIYGEFVSPPLDPEKIRENQEKEKKKSKASEEKQAPAESDASKIDEQAESKQSAQDEEAEVERLRKQFVTTVWNHSDNANLEALMHEKLKDRYRAETPPDSTGMLMFVYLFVTVILFVVIWSMFRRARDQFMGGGLLSGFTKSPAQRYDSDQKRITFKDVAGLDGVKRDLEEVIEFLKDPQKFQRLGGRVPKGVLLMGPPGTGKTLLARAVAGEAGVPFFSISGSEFIQMFVGVGASRVRDLFKTAKEASPAILFIDEIDAVGRHRGAGLGGGNDEREQTLNQILSEMDGFEPTQSVIVLAATNRPDVLDPALLRPGRFDRHITVDRPTYKGRIAIFGVHVRNVPLADDVDIERLAAGSIGLTGADIRNLVNEAALWATRRGKDKVEMEDFEHARDKVLMGSKREEILNDHEKEMTAYHEAGHALLAWIIPGADRVHKVTIVPRGRALGVTQLVPDEERFNISENDLHARLTFILGGRAAEKLIYDEYSAGAESDLAEATKLARRMVSHWGMSERLGPVAYHTTEENPFLGKEFHSDRQFSEHTAQVIDEEVARILHGSAERAMELLRENTEKLEKIARGLIQEEILDEHEIEALIGPSVNSSPQSNGRPATGKTSDGSSVDSDP